MSPTFQPTVSIIINTLNRGALLDDALIALQGLDYPNFEVIAVNGPSTDNSAQVLERWADRIKVLSCAEPNLSVSRNVGIEAAAGEIVCFIDDDAAPHPQWLKRMVGHYHDDAVGAVGGFTVDNTGVRWQVRKTVCDRFGNAFNVSTLFDERPLNFPGTPYFPSLLGTNSSFRTSAVRSIGGFDHAFAYMLDETDVCLRIVDSGLKVIYEPTALVYHQFAPSHIRSVNRIARTLYPSAVSRGYFIMRHGAKQSLAEAGVQFDKFRTEILEANEWLQRHDQITEQHRFSLDEDLVQGLDQGVELARKRSEAADSHNVLGDLNVEQPPPPFRRFSPSCGMRIALVTQGYPPNGEAGIARWTAMVAKGLSARGHQIHVITQTSGDESVTFRDGLWLHKLKPDPSAAPPISEAYAIPDNISGWCARVWREAQYLKSFGLQLLSFPIWDLEGLPVLDDPDLATVVSLHTTYQMAKPFKPEWNISPIYAHHFVARMIAAEKDTLARAPAMLANSVAIMDEIQDAYGVNVRDRSELVPHGTWDPLTSRSDLAADQNARCAQGAPLRVLFVGRFEPRKGFDIAARVAAKIANKRTNIEMQFVGDTISNEHRLALKAEGIEFIEHDPAIRFLGSVDRAQLDDLYASSDLVLTPSRFESFGLVAIEAMAAGRPVLALAVGGLGEVVEDGVTGRTWPDTKKVADQIVAEILRLNANRTDLQALGRNARHAFETRYTVEAMALGIESFYQRIIANRAMALQS